MYVLTAEDNRSKRFKKRISSLRYFFLSGWKKKYYEREIDMLERELFKRIEENRKKEDEKRVFEEMRAWERQRIEEAKYRDQIRKNVDDRAKHIFNKQNSFFDEPTHQTMPGHHWVYENEKALRDMEEDRKDSDHKDHTHPLRDDHHHHRDHHNDHKASWGHDADWNHGDSHKSDSTHTTHTHDNHDSHSHDSTDSGGGGDD